MLRQSMNRLKVSVTGIFLLSFLATPCLSTTQSPDSEQPIKITSDTAEFDDKTGYAIHKGHVVLDQGSRHLTADTLIIKRNEDNKVYLMVAKGKPAKFHAQPEPDKPIGYGEANTLKFYPIDDKIILIDNAELLQDKDQIKGPILTYHLNRRMLESAPKDGQRTTVIIQPTRTNTEEKKHG